MPVISIIIPTYNRSSFVQEAIDSVLAQKFVDFELIVVDDGSTDDTHSALKKYNKSIKYIYQRNKGVSAARNTGVRESSGEWLAFLDSDDLWKPKKLTVQYNYLKDNPTCLICQTEEIWIKNGQRINPKKRHQKQSGQIFKASLPLCIVSPSAVMIHRSLFEQMHGFDESLPACEDYDLWLRISCQYPIDLIQTPLIIKRGGHNDQLSNAPRLDRYRIQSLYNILNSNMLTYDQYQSALFMLQEKCRIYATGCFKYGRIEEANYYQSLPNKVRIMTNETIII